MRARGRRYVSTARHHGRAYISFRRPPRKFSLYNVAKNNGGVTMAEKHRVRISRGNIKMGAIPSVSLPPVLSCGRDIPCAAGCYVVRNMLRGPHGAVIAKSYRANYEFACDDIAGYFAAIAKFITKNRPVFFRFHVSGDFLNSDYFGRCCDIARAHPATKFLAFTKRHDLLPPGARGVPRNFSIIASMWPSWGVRPRGYRCAWYQNGFETRAPKNSVLCNGNCTACGVCFNIRAIGRDVVFMAH